MKLKHYARLAAGAALTVCLAGQAQASGAGITNDDMMRELKRMIEQQQAQLDRQAAEIEALKEMLAGNEAALAEKMDKDAIPDSDKLVISSKANVDVSLYGQVNRAGLWATNGDSSRLYFVDNDNSSTRLGIKASALFDDFEIGGKIEYQLESNSSNLVNINDEDPNNDISLRHADLYFGSKTYGTLSIGRGSSASDGSSEVDLSGTGVITYSGIVDMAGGQLYYDDTTDSLTGVSINSAFSNMDGLGRTDRFRYDSPSFSGITLSASANENDSYDFVARYSRDYGSVKVAGALAWAKAGLNFAAWKHQYNGSLSMLHSSGFNLTLAGGSRDYDTIGRDDPMFFYTKLGYQTQLFPVGISAFSIDYEINEDMAMNGDEGSSYSVAYVQNLDDWGTELYLAYRLYELDRIGTDYDSINAVMGGARIKF